jgi:hypothetical protein
MGESRIRIKVRINIFFNYGRSSRNFTGNFVVDEDILKEEGVSNFDQYACVPGAKLLPDFFLVRIIDQNV